MDKLKAEKDILYFKKATPCSIDFDPKLLVGPGKTVSGLWWIGFFVDNVKLEDDFYSWSLKVDSDLIEKHHHTHTNFKHLDSGSVIYETVVKTRKPCRVSNASAKVNFYYPEKLHISKWERG
jgi:hypothetical protein